MQILWCKKSYFRVILATTVRISINILNYVTESPLYSLFFSTNFVIQSNQRSRFSSLPLFNRLLQQIKNNKRRGTGIKKIKKLYVRKKHLLIYLSAGTHAFPSKDACINDFHLIRCSGKKGDEIGCNQGR